MSVLFHLKSPFHSRDIQIFKIPKQMKSNLGFKSVPMLHANTPSPDVF